MCARGIRHNRSGRLGDDAPIAADDGAGWQVEFAPPHHVGEVTERADHGNACAFVGLRKWVRIHADFHIKQWRSNGFAKQRCVALIIGMRHQTDAGRNQLRSRRFNNHITLGSVKCHRVISPRAFAIFQFGLCHCGAKIDVPQSWCFLCVGLAARQVVEKRALRRAPRMLRDGRVQQRPIHRQPEAAEQIFKHLLVLSGEFVTQLDEVRPRHGHCTVVFGWVTTKRRHKAGRIRQRRVTGDTEIVLHASLGG